MIQRILLVGVLLLECLIASSQYDLGILSTSDLNSSEIAMNSHRDIEEAKYIRNHQKSNSSLRAYSSLKDNTIYRTGNQTEWELNVVKEQHRTLIESARYKRSTVRLLIYDKVQ